MDEETMRLKEGETVMAALRSRDDMVIRKVIEALGEAHGFGRVYVAVREVWLDRQPDFAANYLTNEAREYLRR